jgi:hypothetical protein
VQPQLLYIIESHKFHDLLIFMREGLKEDDIPHLTRLREAVIEAWHRWFSILRTKLSVSLDMHALPTFKF